MTVWVDPQRSAELAAATGLQLQPEGLQVLHVGRLRVRVRLTLALTLTLTLTLTLALTLTLTLALTLTLQVFHIGRWDSRSLVAAKQRLTLALTLTLTLALTLILTLALALALTRWPPSGGASSRRRTSWSTVITSAIRTRDETTCRLADPVLAPCQSATRLLASC